MLRERARGEPVVVLSTNVWPGFPAALYADTRWASRFPALWFLPGLYEGVPRAAPFAYRTPEQMGPLERWHLDAVVEDFAAQPPRADAVRRKQVSRFRRLWCPFRKRERWERIFVVYERDPARADACESGGGGERPASR